jgi:hypothetical protein
MTSYADVDGVIDAWVKATGSTLFTEWADQPARYFHVPGAPPFESFQISVNPPSSGRIAVTARALDTNDDTEDNLERTWEGPVEELNQMLSDAVAIIEVWKRRQLR